MGGLNNPLHRNRRLMFIMSELRHCLWNSPQVPKAKPFYPDRIAHRILARGVWMQRPPPPPLCRILNADTCGGGKEANFSKRRQKCSHANMLINVAAQHSLQAAPQRSGMAAIVKSGYPLREGMKLGDFCRWFTLFCFLCGKLTIDYPLYFT